MRLILGKTTNEAFGIQKMFPSLYLEIPWMCSLGKNSLTMHLQCVLLTICSLHFNSKS